MNVCLIVLKCIDRSLPGSYLSLTFQIQVNQSERFFTFLYKTLYIITPLWSDIILSPFNILLIINKLKINVCCTSTFRSKCTKGLDSIKPHKLLETIIYSHLFFYTTFPLQLCAYNTLIMQIEFLHSQFH